MYGLMTHGTISYIGSSKTKKLELIKDIDRNQYEGISKPERLSGDLSEYVQGQSPADSIKYSYKKLPF